ncbi:MAG: hypothetical protein AAGH15_00745 [Myxococcota bacterium]
MDAEHYRAELEKVIAGRPWLVATDILVFAVAQAKELQELGASKVFALGASRGTGEVEADFPTADLALAKAPDMMTGIRASEAALELPPAPVQAAIDAFDPAGEARVIRALFSADRPVAGRAPWGTRPDRWAALEDKMRVDTFWDAAGVPRAPSAIVPIAEAGEAHARLDAGAGTVWVADNRTGWHGAAQYLRWVRDDPGAAAAAAELGEVADRVRVMPFLEGIPCSMHGFVFPDGQTIALRACEMLVLRTPGSARLAYAAASTFWLPRDEDAEAMRTATLRTAARLRDAHGYVGSFTVDGVVTEEGFRPTELNPRFGAAIARLAKGEPRLPLYLLHLALTAGEDLDYRPKGLETLLVEASLKKPAGSAWRGVPRAVEAREAALVVDEGVRFAAEGETPTFRVRMGPGVTGGIVFVDPEPARVSLGPPLAPRVAAAFNFLDAEWELGLEPVEAAKDVRPR